MILEALCRGRAVLGGRRRRDPRRRPRRGERLPRRPERRRRNRGRARRSCSPIATLAERLGAQALEDSHPWRYTAAEYAENVAALVERVSVKLPASSGGRASRSRSRRRCSGASTRSRPSSSGGRWARADGSRALERRTLRAGAAVPDRAARRARVLRRAAVPGRSGAPPLPARCGARPGAAGDRARPARARALPRVPTKVIVDVHGDWRAPTRLYGSRGRRLLDPLADALARVGLRRADGVRTISAYTSGLVRASRPRARRGVPGLHGSGACSSARPAPLPGDADRALRRRARALQGRRRARRTRGPRCAPASPARSCMSSARARYRRRPATGSRGLRALTTPEVAAALDAATLLVLPSRSEGLGRVVVEAFCRGRAVVGSRVGGIPDLVRTARTGCSSSRRTLAALAEALVRLLSDRALAARLGAGGTRGVQPWVATPEEFARRLARPRSTAS